MCRTKSGHYCTVRFGYIITVFFAFVASLPRTTHCLEDWRINQVSHQPRSFNNTELDKLCRLTDVSRINNYLDNILISRPAGSENNRKVAFYIRDTLESSGYRVEYDHFSQDTVIGRVSFRNIIATLDPYAPRRLVLACHYDSKDFRPGFEFLGATDSALPCALLLDVAQSLKDLIKNRPQNDITLQLIFFDGEEAFRQWTSSDSLYGSRHLADKWDQTLYPPNNIYGIRELDRIDVLVLLDLLGAPYPVIQNYAVFNNRNTYKLLSESEQQLQYIPGCLRSIPTIFRNSDLYASTEDDHMPFLQKSVKVVHLIPVPFPAVWHQEKDNREALDPSTIENLSAILRTFTARYLIVNP